MVHASADGARAYRIHRDVTFLNEGFNDDEADVADEGVGQGGSEAAREHDDE